MDEEMILKVSFCSKSWFDQNSDHIRTSDSEKESLANMSKGKPCIVATDNYPEIDIYAVFLDCKEASLSDDIYPNIVEMSGLLKDIDGINSKVQIDIEGFNPSEDIKLAISEVMKLLMPQYEFYYEISAEEK